VLRLRAPHDAPRFVPLGKPHAPIFEAALQRSPTKDKRRIVMLGDQFVTDVRGAHAFGIDSVFMETAWVACLTRGCTASKPLGCWQVCSTERQNRRAPRNK